MEYERQRAYDRREGKLEGITEGSHQSKIETAEKLFYMNVLTDEQIAEATGLTLEQVLEIKESVVVAK